MLIQLKVKKYIAKIRNKKSAKKRNKTYKLLAISTGAGLFTDYSFNNLKTCDPFPVVTFKR